MVTNIARGDTPLWPSYIHRSRSQKSVLYWSRQADQRMVGYDILVMATGSFFFVPPVPGMTIPEEECKLAR